MEFLSFTPHTLLRGGHRQTLAGAYLWRRVRYRAERHVVALPDGDQLVLHEDCPDSWQPQRPTVLLAHGLAGCHQSGYMQRIAHRLFERGSRVFRIDMRGCGAGMALARHCLHAGRTDDLDQAIGFVHDVARGSPLALVGFSLGASITLKLVGAPDAKHVEKLAAAIAVAPPLDLAACSRNLSAGANRLYDRSFVRQLHRYLATRRKQVDLVGFPTTVSAAPRTLYEFDATYTAPLGGFDCVNDYYRQSSSLPDLPNIRVPTRILYAVDDPLVPADVFQSAEFSPSTTVHATRSGGHLGYLADRAAHDDPDWHWMDWRIVEWISELDDAACR